MSKDLYLLVDGTHADPSECDLGADHELRHSNGVPVALDANGNPQTVAQGAIDNKNVEAAEAGERAFEEASKIIEDDRAAVKEGLKSPNEVRSGEEIEQPSDDDLLMTTDDPKPEDKPVKAKAAKPSKAKTYKNRELRSR